MNLIPSFMGNLLQRGLLVTLVTSLAIGVGGCGGKSPAVSPEALSGALSAAGPLLESIGKGVPGLSQAQSILGLGSLLGLAKAKMPAGQFSQLSGAMPGADALLGEAVKQGLPSQLTGLADVAGFLGKSGISSSQLNQMIPLVSNSLTGKVSPEIATAFASALK